MPVVSFESPLDGCRNLLCSAVSWLQLQRGVPDLPCALCSALGGSTESSAWLGKAAWAAEKEKDGFTCTAATAQAVEGRSWINLGVTAIRTVSSVGFSDLRHALECIYKNKYRLEYQFG